MTHSQTPKALRAAAILLLVCASSSLSHASPILFSVSTPLYTQDLRGIVVGDIDGDGDLDAVLTSPANDAIIWLENEQDFWTSHAVNNPTTDPMNGAHGVALGDIDNDGDLDIVSSARIGGTVDWWSNDNGDGSAWTGTTIAATAPGVRGVTIADIDLDGRLDVAAAVTGANELRWWRQGATSWLGRVVKTGVLDVREVVAADIDGDGDLDLVASSLTDDEVSWWHNPRTSNATNWFETTIATVSSPHGLAVVDMDGDGDKDVVAGDQANGQLRLLRNPTVGGGLWTNEGVSTAGSAPSTAAVSFADFDRDGDLDLLSAGVAADALVWFDNNSSAGTFTARPIPIAGKTIPNAAVADLEKDGDADLLVIESVALADDRARVISNEDLGRGARFVAEDVFMVGGVDSVADPVAHDVDGDGDTDLVYIRDMGVIGGNKEIVWSENPGEIAISGGTMTTHTVGLGLFFTAVSLAVGDLDQDGDQDILVAEFDSTVRFFRYCENLNGIGTSWACSLRLPSGASGVFDADGPMALGDIDNDGDLDAVVTTTTWGSAAGPQDGLFWFENLGDMSQTFAFTEHLVTTEQFDAQIEIVDLNGDGFSDILAAGSRSVPVGSFKVFYGDGGATWTNTTVSWEEVSEFDVGDVDRDGDLDIVVITEDSIRYFRQEPGGFPSVVAYQFPGSESSGPPEESRGGSIYRLRGLELADLNQDGDLDILGSYDIETEGATVAGAPYLLANMSETLDGENRGGDWPTWAYVELPIANLRTAVSAIDLNGDGRLDVHYRVANILDRVVLNTGGNLAVIGSDISPNEAVGGAETNLLSVALARRDVGGEEIGLEAIALRLEDGSGNPITQGQLGDLLDSFRLLLLPPVLRGSTELAAEWQSAVIDANGEILLVLDNSNTPPLPVVIGGMNGPTRFLTLALVPKADLGVLAPSALELRVVSGTEATTVNTGRTVLVEPPTSAVASVNLVEPVVDAIFADGFESGSTAAWSP